MSSKPIPRPFFVLPWSVRKCADECVILSALGDIVARCYRIEDAMLIVALANEYDARLTREDDELQIRPEPAWRRVLIDLRDILAVLWPFVLLIAILTFVAFIGGALWHMSR